MNLWTILNPRHPMFPGERRERLTEWAWATAARHLPKKLAYWSYIHVTVTNIERNEEVPAVPATVIGERFGKAMRSGRAR